jgi:hypothetical protein
MVSGRKLSEKSMLCTPSSLLSGSEVEVGLSGFHK